MTLMSPRARNEGIVSSIHCPLTDSSFAHCPRFVDLESSHARAPSSHASSSCNIVGRELWCSRVPLNSPLGAQPWRQGGVRDHVMCGERSLVSRSQLAPGADNECRAGSQQAGSVAPGFRDLACAGSTRTCLGRPAHSLVLRLVNDSPPRSSSILSLPGH
jgi:hypothetical protein